MTASGNLTDATPLVVIGMHRSGTSLAVRLLADLGVHVGSKLSMNAEDVHLRRLNERIFRRARAEWCRVEPLMDAMARTDFVESESERLRHALFDRRALDRFFGRDRREDAPWGWKDPRTTLTFPIWLRVFPRARFVHVVRDGIDVAISLHRRALRHRQWWKRLSPVHNVSPLMLDFARCFALWQSYVSWALDTAGVIPSDQYLQLRYEDLLAAPEATLSRIATFANIEADAERIKSVCAQVNAARLDNASLVATYGDEIAPLRSNALMARLGYSKANDDHA